LAGLGRTWPDFCKSGKCPQAARQLEVPQSQRQLQCQLDHSSLESLNNLNTTPVIHVFIIPFYSFTASTPTMHWHRHRLDLEHYPCRSYLWVRVRVSTHQPCSFILSIPLHQLNQHLRIFSHGCLVLSHVHTQLSAQSTRALLVWDLGVYWDQ
jgi:hypothetical protein